MAKISRENLLSLEKYAEQRGAIRAEVMAHKKTRQVPIGEHLTLHFEDETTMRYQVQEMLRIEKLFEPGEIEDELAAYNPLIPDGSNWKATVMIEYSDETERRRRLAELKGIENTLHIEVEGFDPVYAIVNEDMERSTDDKTSAVHFARFEFTMEMIETMKSGARIIAGVRHDAYPEGPAQITGAVRESLVADFD